MGVLKFDVCSERACAWCKIKQAVLINCYLKDTYHLPFFCVLCALASFNIFVALRVIRKRVKRARLINNANSTATMNNFFTVLTQRHLYTPATCHKDMDGWVVCPIFPIHCWILSCIITNKMRLYQYAFTSFEQLIHKKSTILNSKL